MFTIFSQDVWKRLPPRWRLLFLLLATGFMAAFSTYLLMRESLKEVLYKAF